MSEAGIPRTLVVVNGRVLMQACALYKHPCAVLNLHHIVPESWWVAAGKAVASPMRALCPNCHNNVHAAIDGLIAGRDLSVLPPRCVALAREGLVLAGQNGLTPTRTL